MSKKAVSNTTGKNAKSKSRLNETPADFLSDQSQTIPCEYQVWNQALVDEIIQEALLSMEQLSGTGQASTTGNTKSAATSRGASRGRKEVKSSASMISNDSPEDLRHPPISKLRVYEWKSILLKRNPCLVRNNHPVHPYFDIVNRDRQTNMQIEQERMDTSKNNKKKPQNTAKPKAKSDDEKYPESEIGSLHEVSYDAETVQNILEDYDKYMTVPEIISKGPWTDAFISAIMLVTHHCNNIEFGNYLWERIYPKQTGSEALPLVSPLGKYYIKLYYLGHERIVVVDDLLPHDDHGKVLFPITEKNEYWPSILMKGLLRLCKGKEDILFKDPLWVFSCLTGWDPCTLSSKIGDSWISEARKTLQISKKLEDTFDFVKHLQIVNGTPAIEKVQQQRHSIVVCATMKAFYDIPDAEPQEISDLGLGLRKVYIIHDVKTVHSEDILHLISINVQWTGKYNYIDTSSWTAEFEEALQFSYQDRLQSLVKTDFWISSSDFQKHFDFVHIFYDASGYQKETTLIDRLPDELWLYNEEQQECMIRCYPRVMTLDKEILQCKIELFNWKARKVFETKAEFLVPPNSLFPLPLPTCGNEQAVKLTVERSSPNLALSFLSHKTLIIGQRQDILHLKMKVLSFHTDAEQYPEQKEGDWKLWFIKKLTGIKETGFLRAELVLHADESSENQVLPKPVFMLINEDNKAVVQDIDLLLPPVEIGPNKAGYTLVAYCKSKRVSTNAGTMSIHITCDPVISELDSIQGTPLFRLPFIDEYRINSENELFKYDTRVGEPTNLSLFLRISHKVPVTVEISCSEEEVGKPQTASVTPLFRTTMCEKSELIPLLLLAPTDAKMKRNYIFRATIDQQLAQVIQKKRLHRISQMYENMLKQKAEKAKMESQDEVQKYEDNIEAHLDTKNSRAPSRTSILLSRRQSEVSSKSNSSKTKSVKSKASVAPSKTNKQQKKEHSHIPTKLTQPEIIGFQLEDETQHDGDADIYFPEHAKIELHEGNNEYSHLRYELILYTNGPNVVIEKINTRKRKLEQLSEDWEQGKSGRIADGKEVRKRRLEERAKQMTQLVVVNQKDFSLPPIHVKPYSVRDDPNWTPRRFHSWLIREERLARESNNKPQGSMPYMNAYKVLTNEDLELKKHEILDSIRLSKDEMTSIKQKREEWSKKQQDKYLKSDAVLNGYSARLRDNFTEKSQQRTELREEKAAERARLEEIERQRLAEEEKERKLQQKNSRSKTPGKKK